MIQPPLWRQIQRESFTAWDKLADFLELGEQERSNILKSSRFPLYIPLRLAKKVKKNCLSDPILLQFLPLIKEEILQEGFSKDPVKDATFRKSSKLLQKYKGRALLVTTSACAMHCRYCFRKNFDYNQESDSFEKELNLLAEDDSITEIILSGGDPLSLSNKKLEELIHNLEKIKHLKRLRFHTRFPVGIPERIDAGFLEILEKTSLQVWFVLHCNHPSELDEDVVIALKKIQKLGIPVLNQAVLLKGVNDSLPVLKELCEKLINNGAQPYYLHQLDPVQGAGHFEVPVYEGLKLVEALTAELSGYGIPKYVREIPGDLNKTPLNMYS